MAETIYTTPFLVNPRRRRKPTRRRLLASRPGGRRNALDAVILGGTMNPHRKRGRRRRFYLFGRNPRRRRGGGGGATTLAAAFSPQRVMNVLPLAVTGSLSAISASAVPRFMAIDPVTSPWVYRGTQLLTATLGGMLIGQMVDSRHGTIWTVTGIAMIAMETVVGPLLAQFLPAAAVSAYPGVPGQFPSWPQSLSAYPTMGQVPYEQRTSNGMGAYLHESIPVGAPYGG